MKSPINRYLSSLAMIACAIIGTTNASTVLYDFNNTAQFGENFTIGKLSVSQGTITSAAAGGLDDSGSLALPPQFSDSFIYTTNDSVSATFASINVSVYFQVAASSALTGVGLATTIGLVDALPTASEGGAPTGVPSPIGQTPITAGFFPANSFVLNLRHLGQNVGTGLDFSLGSYNNGSNTGLAASSAVALTGENWYMLEAAYTYNGTNSYTLTGQIYNSDISGVIGSALIASGNSWTVTNAGLADGDTHFLLSSQNGARRGIDRFDNYSFAAVPEPSTTAMLIGAGIFGIILVRRRRNALG